MKIVMIGTIANCVFGFRISLIKELISKGHEVYAFAHDYSNDEKQRLGIGVKVANQNAIWKVKRKLTVPLSELHVLGKVVQIVKNLED